VIGGITNWSQLSGGGTHSLGLTSTGIAYAWGYNYDGQLGDGTIDQTSSPVTVVGGITNWSQVSAGRSHNLSILQLDIKSI
jgi:alpha-tubulin suppressor-like RCC1 family protein